MDVTIATTTSVTKVNDVNDDCDAIDGHRGGEDHFLLIRHEIGKYETLFDCLGKRNDPTFEHQLSKYIQIINKNSSKIIMIVY